VAEEDALAVGPTEGEAIQPEQGKEAAAPLPESASPPAKPEPTDEAPFVHQPPSILFFWIVALLSAAADLASKAWASKALTGYDPTLGHARTVTVIKNFMDLQYAQNPGGAWSMLRTMPEVARRPFFLVVSTVASVFIASIYPRIDRRQWAMRFGLPLALGGALGNLADRIRHGWVVDFVHVWVKRGQNEYQWPTFNVADVWIVVGVGLMALDVLFSRRLRAELVARSEASEAQPDETEPDGDAA
jgi:signal peptidase II